MFPIKLWFKIAQLGFPTPLFPQLCVKITHGVLVANYFPMS